MRLVRLSHDHDSKKVVRFEIPDDGVSRRHEKRCILLTRGVVARSFCHESSELALRNY